MARTQLSGSQIEDGTVERADLNVTIPGSAVVRRLLPGVGIRFTSTGADSGTGDVTIHADGPIPDREISGTSDTPIPSDAGTLLRTLSASDTAITLNGTSFPVMGSYTVVQEGTGQITFVADTGNEIIGTGPFQSKGQGAGMIVMYLGDAKWWVSGDLETGDSGYTLPASLASIAGLTTSANQGLYTTGSNTYTTYALTAYGRTLGGLADAAALRTNAGLVIGTNVQAYSANLTAWAGLATSAKQDQSANLDAWSALATSAKQNTHASLTSIAGLTTAAGTSIYTTASNTYATYATSASGRGLSNIGGTSGSMAYLSGTDIWSLVATSAGGRALLNAAGTANTIPYYSTTNTVGTIAVGGANAVSLIGAANYAAMRALLDLEVGSDLQAWSSNLDGWAAITVSSKQNANANLSLLAGVTLGNNSLFYTDGAGAGAVTTLTAAGRALLDDADAAAQRTTLGITSIATITLPGGTSNFLRADGTWAVPAGEGVALSAAMTSMNGQATVPINSYWYTSGSNAFTYGTITAFGRSLVDDADAAAGRTTLGLAIGTDVQAYSANLAAWSGLATSAKQDANANLTAWSAVTIGSKQDSHASLTSIAGLTTSAGTAIYTTASNTYATYVTTADGRALVGAADYAAMRTALGLAIGTNVQAYSANLAAWSGLATSAKQDTNEALTSIAGLTTAAGTSIYTTALNTYATYATSASGRNLSNIGGTADSISYLSSANTWSLTSISAAGRSIINLANPAASAIVLLSSSGVGSTLVFPGGTTDFLRADGTFATPAGGGGATLSASLTSMNGQTSVPADRTWYSTGVDTWGLATITAAGRALIDDEDAAAQRTTLGLVIGTNVQAYNASLAAFAGLTFTNSSSFWVNASGVPSVYTQTAFGTSIVAAADAAAARTVMGLTAAATLTFPGGTTDFLRADGSWAVPSGGGGGSSTLAITASEALSAGQLVNLHSTGGNPRVRRANATTAGVEANGFVLAAVSSSASATVYKPGEIITGLVGLTADASYFLSTTAGGITTTPPNASGNIVQYIGRALTTTTLYFNPHPPITVS